MFYADNLSVVIKFRTAGMVELRGPTPSESVSCNGPHASQIGEQGSGF